MHSPHYTEIAYIDPSHKMKLSLLVQAGLPDTVLGASEAGDIKTLRTFLDKNPHEVKWILCVCTATATQQDISPACKFARYSGQPHEGWKGGVTFGSGERSLVSSQDHPAV